MKPSFTAFAVTILSVFMSATVAVASVGDRVALVIGNENYEAAAALKNPINDATAIAGKLETLGFDVVKGTDLGYDALRDTVREFTRRARKADVTIFYYAGHGIAVDGENYIVPVDAKLSDPVDWEFEVYNVAEILRLIDRSPGPSLVFLDACRDNPLASVLANAQGMSSRSLNNRGISRIPTETMGASGSVIAYATEPGQVAADGSGDNSPFALALLEHIGTENTDFASVTSLITRDVIEMTDGVQRPRFDVSLTGPLILNERVAPEPLPANGTETASLNPQATQPAQPATSDTLQVEKFMFETAMASNDPADFEAFLSAFPNSMFAPMAQNAISRIQGEAADVAAVEEQMAALNTNPSQQPVTVTRVVNAPFSLSVTPQALALLSNEATETALGMNRTQLRQMQLRLNLAGYNVGTPDGLVGPKTRNGVRAWQSANGFLATGYLNNVQHQYLTASTHSTYTAHLAANPNALTPVARKKISSSNSKKSTTKRKSSGNNDFVKGVITGVGAAIILGR